MSAVDLATLPAMDVGARATRVRAGFETDGVDALLVTRLPNVRYLTGFTGSAGMVALTPDALVLVTDGRYAEQSREQLGDRPSERSGEGSGEGSDERRARGSRPGS